MKHVYKIGRKILLLIIFAFLFSACSHGLVIIEGKRGGAKVVVRDRDHGDRHKKHDRHERRDRHKKRKKDKRHRKAPRIPPGHMPPPGSCRIWYPNTPPGQQPPPGDCRKLARQVPPWAWLIHG